MSLNSLEIGEHKKSIKIEIYLDIVTDMEGKYWIAYCPALELSSYSDKEDKLIKSFNETLKIYFEETLRKGTLEKDLLRLGWVLQQVPTPRYEPPKIDFENVFKNFINPSIIKKKVSLPVFC